MQTAGSLGGPSQALAAHPRPALLGGAWPAQALRVPFLPFLETPLFLGFFVASVPPGPHSAAVGALPARPRPARAGRDLRHLGLCSPTSLPFLQVPARSDPGPLVGSSRGLPPLSPRRGEVRRGRPPSLPLSPVESAPALPAAAARPAFHLDARGASRPARRGRTPPPPRLGPGPAARWSADPGEAVRAAGRPGAEDTPAAEAAGRGAGSGPGRRSDWRSRRRRRHAGRAEGGARRGVGRRKREPGSRVRAG